MDGIGQTVLAGQGKYISHARIHVELTCDLSPICNSEGHYYDYTCKKYAWNHSIGQLGLLQPILLSFASPLWHIAIASHFAQKFITFLAVADRVLPAHNLPSVEARSKGLCVEQRFGVGPSAGACSVPARHQSSRV